MEQSLLKLFFASDVQTLTDNIILDIKQNWLDPFVSPIVIFPEFKIQQWFKREWIKSCPDAAIANLNCKSIDSFLFEILKSKNDNIEKLTVDVLTNVVISYLLQNDNWKKLDDYVTHYLTKAESTDQIDETKLFDFANTISGLFLEYESSRPSDFICQKGFLDCWNQNVQSTVDEKINPDAYFFAKLKGQIPSEQEIFQRKLYSAIFHEQFDKTKNVKQKSFLSCVFDKMNQALNENQNKETETRLLTLQYLFNEKNKKFENAPDKSIPIYMFLISGMGQFYRIVLDKLSETHNIKVYLQNPCIDFYKDEKIFIKNSISKKTLLDIEYNFSIAQEPFFEEENKLSQNDENMLLMQWGKVGRDNIRLYKNSVEQTFFDSEKIKNDSLLHCVQNSIKSRKNKIEDICQNVLDQKEKLFVNDNSLCVTACPNKLREIENIYSKICTLLSENKDLRLDDFLVYAPDIDSYRATINQVFMQTESDDKNFVTLPFCIVDSASSNSFTATALKKLFDIALKGSLNRVDFFTLVHNPVVQQVRSILSEEILFWENWISEMNVFRDRQNIELNEWNEDWSKGVKRLLLSNFSATEICSSEEKIYFPFDDINSSDKDSVFRFVDCIESLEQWIDFAKSKKCYSLEKVKEFLSSWLLLPTELAPEIKKELGQEKKVFKNLLSGIENINFQFYAGSEFISFQNLSLSLQNSIASKKLSGAKVFENGITFLSFSSNRILPAKYTFIIGLGSKVFPGVRNYKSLDLRNDVRTWPGDDNIPNRNRYAFLCQLMNTKEGLFISYESMDLKKDEEFYASSVVNDLQSFIKKLFYSEDELEKIKSNDVWQENKMTLEETRPYSQLFTSREFRNKKNKQLLSITSELKQKNTSVNKKEFLPRLLTESVFIKFLKEPYKFQTDRVLSRSEDFDDASEAVAFENVELSALKNSEVRTELLKLKFQIPSDYKNELDLKDKMIAKGVLPDGIFGASQWQDLLIQVQNVFENLQTIKEDFVLPAKLQGKINPKKIEYTFDSFEQIPEWTISSEIPFYIEQTNTIIFVSSDLKGSWKEDIEKMLKPYLQILILSILGINANCVFVSAKSIKTPTVLNKENVPDKDSAKEIFRELYKKMYIENFSLLLPLKCIKENSQSEKIATFEDLKAELNGTYSTIYENKLLELTEENTGYTDFKNQWNQNCLMQSEFVKCLEPLLPSSTKKEKKGSEK